MAKKKQLPKKLGGPYLAAAVFCEGTIEDKNDSAVSVIRIIDQITLQVNPAAPSDFPSESNRINIPFFGFMAFRTGDSPGEHVVRLVMQSPSGKKQQVLEQTVQFLPQPHSGANIRLNGHIAIKDGGLFWLHVFLDGKRVTRMPLQITVQRQEAVNPTPVPSDVPTGGKKTRISK